MDLTCASGKNLWLILSSEGCPKSNSSPDQPITKCEALAGIISRPNAVRHLFLPTPHLNQKKLSTNSSWDFEHVFETMDDY